MTGHLGRATDNSPIGWGPPPAQFPEATDRQVRDTLWTLATQQGRQPELAVDDAHRLPPRLLQELRFVRNDPLDSTAPVALVLWGHTAWPHTLALRPLDAMRQRVTVADHLPPLFAATAAARERGTCLAKQCGTRQPSPATTAVTWCGILQGCSLSRDTLGFRTPPACSTTFAASSVRFASSTEI